jgi:hypothetical protein
VGAGVTDEEAARFFDATRKRLRKGARKMKPTLRREELVPLPDAPSGGEGPTRSLEHRRVYGKMAGLRPSRNISGTRALKAQSAESLRSHARGVLDNLGKPLAPGSHGPRAASQLVGATKAIGKKARRNARRLAKKG